MKKYEVRNKAGKLLGLFFDKQSAELYVDFLIQQDYTNLLNLGISSGLASKSISKLKYKVNDHASS